MNISRLLLYHAQYRGDRIAFEFADQQFTFAELNDSVNRLANALLECGLAKGDKFATLLDNSIELVLAYWAAAAGGLVIVPCSYLLQAGGIKNLLDDSDCRLVIVDNERLARLQCARRELAGLDERRVILTGSATTPAQQAGYVGFDQLVANAATAHPRTPIADDDLYNIMYSSGTTGEPKGIMHTHAIRAMYCTLFANAWRMTPESVVLHAGSLVFNGAMLDFMPWMYLGCRYLLHRQFNPEQVIATIEQHAVTHIVLVPTQIIALLNSPDFTPARLRSLEMLQNVGAPLHLDYKQKINRLLPGRFYELYGVTEGFMTILDKHDAMRKVGSVGKPAGFTDIAILRDDGQPCAAHEVGEICGRGPLATPGYYRQPAMTEQVFRHGWLHSGDLGYLDDDGFLFLVDRKKDMITSGGVNVYPKDIEEILIQHPAVREVAVFGIPSPRWGESPAAAVICRQPVEADGLIDWVNRRVDARYQRLAAVFIVSTLPRNAAGKVLKRELRRQFEATADAESTNQ